MITFFKKLKKLFIIISPFKYKALILFLIMILAAITDVFGITLIIPFLSVILNGENHGYLNIILNQINNFFHFNNIIIPIIFLLLFFQFLKSIFSILEKYISTTFVWRLTERWKNLLMLKYINSTFKYYVSQKQGILFNNILQEPKNASHSLFKIIEFISKFILCISMIITIILIDFRVTLILGFFGVLIFFIVNKLSKSYLVKLGQKKIIIGQDRHSIVAESIFAFPLIKSFSLENFRVKLFNKINHIFCNIQIIILVITSIFTPIIEILIVLIFIIFLYLRTSIDIEKIRLILPSLSVIIIIAQKLFTKIGELTSSNASINFLLPSLSLVHDNIEKNIQQEDIDTGLFFDKLVDNIIFEDLSFSYSGKNIIEKLNIKIPIGKMTAIIGPSGIGKSTIANLLIRFYEPGSGRILVNSKPLNYYSKKSWRNKIGYVTQDTLIFNTTIKENILLGKLDATEEEIIEAAKQAAIHDFIITLPEKYETIVGDRGMRLSGGQKQRIAIARAIIRKPEIYIFDEATSSLDNKSEKLIQKSIERLGEKNTVVIIAHRLTTIENADVVYDLEKI